MQERLSLYSKLSIWHLLERVVQNDPVAINELLKGLYYQRFGALFFETLKDYLTMYPSPIVQGEMDPNLRDPNLIFLHLVMELNTFNGFYTGLMETVLDLYEKGELPRHAGIEGLLQTVYLTFPLSHRVKELPGWLTSPHFEFARDLINKERVLVKGMPEFIRGNRRKIENLREGLARLNQRLRGFFHGRYVIKGSQVELFYPLTPEAYTAQLETWRRAQPVGAVCVIYSPSQENTAKGVWKAYTITDYVTRKVVSVEIAPTSQWGKALKKITAKNVNNLQRKTTRWISLYEKEPLFDNLHPIYFSWKLAVKIAERGYQHADSALMLSAVRQVVEKNNIGILPSGTTLAGVLNQLASECSVYTLEGEIERETLKEDVAAGLAIVVSYVEGRFYLYFKDESAQKGVGRKELVMTDLAHSRLFDQASRATYFTSHPFLLEKSEDIALIQSLLTHLTIPISILPNDPYAYYERAWVYYEANQQGYYKKKKILGSYGFNPGYTERHAHRDLERAINATALPQAIIKWIELHRDVTCRGYDPTNPRKMCEEINAILEKLHYLIEALEAQIENHRWSKNPYTDRDNLYDYFYQPYKKTFQILEDILKLSPKIPFPEQLFIRYHSLIAQFLYQEKVLRPIPKEKMDLKAQFKQLMESALKEERTQDLLALLLNDRHLPVLNKADLLLDILTYAPEVFQACSTHVFACLQNWLKTDFAGIGKIQQLMLQTIPYLSSQEMTVFMQWLLETKMNLSLKIDCLTAVLTQVVKGAVPSEQFTLFHDISARFLFDSFQLERENPAEGIACTERLFTLFNSLPAHFPLTAISQFILGETCYTNAIDNGESKSDAIQGVAPYYQKAHAALMRFPELRQHDLVKHYLKFYLERMVKAPFEKQSWSPEEQTVLNAAINKTVEQIDSTTDVLNYHSLVLANFYETDLTRWRVMGAALIENAMTLMPDAMRQRAQVIERLVMQIYADVALLPHHKFYLLRALFVEANKDLTFNAMIIFVDFARELLDQANSEEDIQRIFVLLLSVPKESPLKSFAQELLSQWHYSAQQINQAHANSTATTLENAAEQKKVEAHCQQFLATANSSKQAILQAYRHAPEHTKEGLKKPLLFVRILLQIWLKLSSLFVSSSVEKPAKQSRASDLPAGILQAPCATFSPPSTKNEVTQPPTIPQVEVTC